MGDSVNLSNLSLSSKLITNDGYYISYDNLANTTIKIKILPGDKIIHNELRRVVKGSTGLPLYNSEIWVAPNGNYYIDGMIEFRPDSYYVIRYVGERGFLKSREFVQNTFSEFKDYNLPETSREICYTIWKSMRSRVASPRYVNELSISEQWQDFWVFCGWWLESVYKLNTELKLDINKAILSDYKEYNRENTIIVPTYINKFFSESSLVSNTDLVGVVQNNKNYSAYVKMEKSKPKYLGRYKTAEQAHMAWVEYKQLRLQDEVIPRYISDIHPDYRNHPMVLRVLDGLNRYKFK